MHWMIRFSLRCMLPGTEALPSVDRATLDRFIIQIRREANLLFRVGLTLASVVFVWLPVLTIGWPLPAFMLPRRWRDAYARRMAAHPVYGIRQLATVLKTSAGLCWGADPRVRARLGLAPYPADPQTFRGSFEGPPAPPRIAPAGETSA